ncbi:MAG TPA: CoA-binding protein [Burkholderiales bacterium]|nr:CoA-binding protein [Burkholderiales bacterium]
MTDDGSPHFKNPSAEEIRALLKRVRTIAVVGLSPNPERPSYGVSRAMQGFGYTVIPVHPAAREILGAKAYPRLSKVPIPIDLVDVFRRPEHIDGIVEECLALKLKNLWIQDDIINIPAAKRAQAGGMIVVMNRCIYRDYVQYCR